MSSRLSSLSCNLSNEVAVNIRSSCLLLACKKIIIVVILFISKYQIFFGLISYTFMDRTCTDIHAMYITSVYSVRSLAIGAVESERVRKFNSELGAKKVESINQVICFQSQSLFDFKNFDHSINTCNLL